MGRSRQLEVELRKIDQYCRPGSPAPERRLQRAVGVQAPTKATDHLGQPHDRQVPGIVQDLGPGRRHLTASHAIKMEPRGLPVESPDQPGGVVVP